MYSPTCETSHSCKWRHNLNIAQQFVLSYMRSEHILEITVPSRYSKTSSNFHIKEQLFDVHLWFIIKHIHKSDTLKENKEVG